MLKFLIASLLSLFVVTSANTWRGGDLTTQAKNTSAVRFDAIDGYHESHGYMYTDDLSSYNPTRTFISPTLAPTIYPNFCAPTGYVYKLGIEESAAAEIAYQAELLDASLTYLNIAFYYGIYGTEVYSDSNSKWYTGDSSDPEELKTWFKDSIISVVKEVELLTIEEVVTSADLYVRMNVQVAVTDEESGDTIFWTMVFRSEDLEISPYSEYDFVDYKLFYYQRVDDEKRITVTPTLIPGFFNEYNSDNNYAYNKYGWLTSTTTEYPYALEPRENGEAHYFCDYKMSLIAFDTVTLGTFEHEDSLELSYPATPIRAKIKLEFTSDENVDYVFYSNDFIIGDPNVRLTVDGAQDRKSVQKNTEHLYSILFDNLETDKLMSLSLNVSGTIDRLIEDGEHVIYCYDGELPSVGEKEVYYYIPTDVEIILHEQGEDEELMNNSSLGTYYEYVDIVDEDTQEVTGHKFEEVTAINFFDINYVSEGYDAINGEWISEEVIPEEELDALLNKKLTFPFEGRFSGFAFNMFAQFTGESSAYIEEEQKETLTITPYIETNNKIILDVDDEVNLVDGGDDLLITPTVSPYDDEVTYYYDYSINKEGIIEVNQDLDGKTTIHPLKAGVVKLTFEVDSVEFSTISKTITIRVIDGVYDNSKIEIKDEFHKAGVDLNASISVRGFTNISNAKLTWKVFDKKGNRVPEERVIANDKNGSMILVNPDSDDYSIEVSYDGVQVSKATVQVRYVDMDAFLKANIWWIVLITLGFLAFVILLASFTKRSKNTVDRIERVYQVYCECISNDSLSKEELVRIKKEITRCLHHCESLNINAFNQYEKATRYLRKSLVSTKKLMKKYDTLTTEEKSVIYEQLNTDLNKALNVAKEIENAKVLIEQYHATANRNNYAVLKDDKKDKSINKNK